MRFWQRAFFSILILFIFCFYSSIFLVASFFYRTNLNNERNRSFGEAYFIAASLKKEILESYHSGRGLNGGKRYSFNAYVNYYRNRNIYLALWQNDAYIAGSVPWVILPQDDTAPDKQTAAVTEYKSKKYMRIVSVFECGADRFTLIYAHDLQDFTSEHRRLFRFLMGSGAAVTMLLAAGLYFILRRLSKPIENLDQATGRISAGDYSMRLPVQGKDELAALAGHFNTMADEIKTKIKELRLIAEQKQGFIDNLAHELRTPLTTIGGYAEYLKNANIDEDDRLSSIDYIISEAKRMEEMTDKLLDLALLRNNVLTLKEVNLPELLHAVSEKMRPPLLEKQLQLEVASEAAVVYGDRILLESLLNNLLDNAVKASKEKSRICLSACSEKEHPVITIRDFGKGIPPECMAKLTEPFYRIDKSRSRSEGGAGIGLALCRQIAELHKAQLIFSSAPEKGTTVKIVFTTS